MSDYSLDCGGKLAAVAQQVADDGLEDLASKQTVAYLSLLSMEVTLKSFLERSGLPVAEIRSYSHDLRKLQEAVARSRITVEITPRREVQMAASSLRALEISNQQGSVTVGEILDAEGVGASPYPSGVRYGQRLTHYPPSVLAKAAGRVHSWALDHWDRVTMTS